METTVEKSPPMVQKQGEEALSKQQKPVQKPSPKPKMQVEKPTQQKDDDATSPTKQKKKASKSPEQQKPKSKKTSVARASPRGSNKANQKASQPKKPATARSKKDTNATDKSNARKSDSEVVHVFDDGKVEPPPPCYAVAKKRKVMHDDEDSDDSVQQIDTSRPAQIVDLVSVYVTSNYVVTTVVTFLHCLNLFWYDVSLHDLLHRFFLMKKHITILKWIRNLQQEL